VGGGRVENVAVTNLLPFIVRLTGVATVIKSSVQPSKRHPEAGVAASETTVPKCETDFCSFLNSLSSDYFHKFTIRNSQFAMVSS